MLAQAILAKADKGKSLSRPALAALLKHPWPGNVRELRNVIERIILMSTETGLITQADVEQVLPKSTGAPRTDDPAELTLDDIERRHILRVLDASGGNKTAAAKTLDIDYKTLLAKLKKFAIDK